MPREWLMAQLGRTVESRFDTNMKGRKHYTQDAMGLIAAGHVIAVEFATIAAANNYWRK